jgi:hypothetical protein
MMEFPLHERRIDTVNLMVFMDAHLVDIVNLVWFDGCRKYGSGPLSNRLRKRLTISNGEN